METKLELAVGFDDPVDSIISDIQRTHIIINSESGHGKSSSLKTIVKEIKKRIPGIVVKCFDPSLAWWHNAPLKYRQRIVMGEPWQNVEDCLYDISELTEDERRIFASVIIKQDYKVRLHVGRNGKKEIGKLPLILYIFEESDTFFDSRSLNKNDKSSEALRDFIKIGRNFQMRAFCVTTATVGELATKLRRRSKHLIGRIISDGDLRFYNRKAKNLGNLAIALPQYFWVYFNGRASPMFRIRDEVTNIPQDYVTKIVVAEPHERRRSTVEKAVIGFIFGALVGLVLCSRLLV